MFGRNLPQYLEIAASQEREERVRDDVEVVLTAMFGRNLPQHLEIAASQEREERVRDDVEVVLTIFYRRGQRTTIQEKGAT